MDLPRMSRFVRMAGIYNLLLAIGMATPFVTELLKIAVCDYALALLISAFLVFTAAVQIIAAHNLPAFASFVYWEGLLRWMAAALLVPYGFFGHLGFMAGVLGVVDFAVGLAFVIALPRVTGFKHVNLLVGK